MVNADTQIKPHIAQIALSVNDIEVTGGWFENLGLVASGGLQGISGEPFASVIGLPALDADMKWLVGKEPMMQLELFKFRAPPARPLAGWSVRQAGYGFVTLAVRDFEMHKNRFVDSGVRTFVAGVDGVQSFWVQSPDGLWVELLQADVLGNTRSVEGQERLASVRALSLSVDDLDASVSFFTSAMGLTPAGAGEMRSFGPLPVQLCGNEGYEERCLKGGNVILRLLRPRTEAPTPKAAGWNLADIGVLNFAIILSDRQQYLSYADHIRDAGFAATTPPVMPFDGAGMMYGHDPQGNSIETGYVAPGFERRFGWHV